MNLRRHVALQQPRSHASPREWVPVTRGKMRPHSVSPEPRANETGKEQRRRTAARFCSLVRRSSSTRPPERFFSMSNCEMKW